MQLLGMFGVSLTFIANFALFCIAMLAAWGWSRAVKREGDLLVKWRASLDRERDLNEILDEVSDELSTYRALASGEGKE